MKISHVLRGFQYENSKKVSYLPVILILDLINFCKIYTKKLLQLQLQSVVWFGLTITGISVYYCTIDFTGSSVNLGSILELSIYKIYFSGKENREKIIMTDKVYIKN